MSTLAERRAAAEEAVARAAVAVADANQEYNTRYDGFKAAGLPVETIFTLMSPFANIRAAADADLETAQEALNVIVKQEQAAANAAKKARNNAAAAAQKAKNNAAKANKNNAAKKAQNNAAAQKAKNDAAQKTKNNAAKEGGAESQIVKGLPNTWLYVIIAVGVALLLIITIIVIVSVSRKRNNSSSAGGYYEPTDSYGSARYEPSSYGGGEASY